MSECLGFSLDAVIKGLVPLSLICAFPDAKVGPNPRLAFGRAPDSSYLSIFALVLTKRMFAEMTWRSVEGGVEFPGIRYITNLISWGYFAAFDLSASFALGDANAEILIATRKPPDSDPIAMFLRRPIGFIGTAMWGLNTRRIFITNFIRNWSGTTKNRVFAHPVKDWCLTTPETISATCAMLIEDGLSTVVWWGLPITWGVYAWFHLALKNLAHYL